MKSIEASDAGAHESHTKERVVEMPMTQRTTHAAPATTQHTPQFSETTGEHPVRVRIQTKTVVMRTCMSCLIVMTQSVGVSSMCCYAGRLQSLYLKKDTCISGDKCRGDISSIIDFT